MYPSPERQRGVVNMNHSLGVVAGDWSIAPRRRDALRFPALQEGFLNWAHRLLYFLISLLVPKLNLGRKRENSIYHEA